MANHYTFFAALQAALAAAQRGDKQFTLQHLKDAMKAANKIDDPQYRKAVFRAMNHARVMPA